MTDAPKPWAQPMSPQRFELMRTILDAPSPIGLEAAMTRGILEPHMRSFMPEDWVIHSFKGNAGICLLYTSPSPRDRTRSRMPSSA